MCVRLSHAGLSHHLGGRTRTKQTNTTNNNPADQSGWRDVAFYIARETNTPAPFVMRYSIMEACRWLSVIQRHKKREQEQLEKEK